MSGTQQVVLIVLGLLAAAAVGSFANVIIDRMPLAYDEPNEYGDLWGTRPWSEVVSGGSRCSDCGEPVRWYDNIPVVSWIVLRGRCRSCRTPYGAFHPVVEFLVPALVAAMAWGLGLSWRLVPVLLLVPVGVAISAIDFRTFIVPTRLVWPAFGVIVAASAVVALAEGEPRWLLGGLVGLLTMAGPLAIIWFVMPSGMGFGDVRLTTVLGWVVGFTMIDDRWTTALTYGFLALGLSAVLGIFFSMVGITARGRRAKVPFGPSLFIGSLATMFIAGVVN